MSSNRITNSESGMTYEINVPDSIPSITLPSCHDGLNIEIKLQNGDAIRIIQLPTSKKEKQCSEK